MSKFIHRALRLPSSTVVRQRAKTISAWILFKHFFGVRLGLLAVLGLATLLIILNLLVREPTGVANREASRQVSLSTEAITTIRSWMDAKVALRQKPFLLDPRKFFVAPPAP